MKYKLTTETKVWYGITLYRIEATESFGHVNKGDKGGFIQMMGNISQDGDARVYGDAWVFGDAQVYGNAWVFGDAWVFGKLKLTAGCFFGVKGSGEKVQEIEIKNGNYLIGKGDIKFGEDTPTETIEIGGIKYSKEEVEKALKVIKAVE